MTLSLLTRFSSQAAAEAAARALARGQATVTRVQAGIAADPPPTALSTALMLQAANAELGWSSAQTMQVAQRLYEGVTVQGRRLGLITYPRTTGTRAVAQAVAEARRIVQKTLGANVLAPQMSLWADTPRRWYEPVVDGARRVWDWAQRGVSRLFGRKPATSLEASAPEAAHECIRPTGFVRAPETLREHLDTETLALYTLIYRRFLDSQKRGEPYRVTTLEVEYDDEDPGEPVTVPVAHESHPAQVVSDIDDW